MPRKSNTGTTFITKRRVSQYEGLMRRYSAQHKGEKCNYEDIMPPPSPHTKVKTYETGSSYEGAYNIMGMNGYGEYTFPNGVVYRGEFQDDMFHGIGELIYKDGPEADCVIHGTWVKGIMKDRKIIFNDILEYQENDWKYCKLPDRRYAAEFETDLWPAGNSLITADVPPREIPPGYYDTVDGFYNPVTKVVHSYENMNKVVRCPSAQEQKWILDNCRTMPSEVMGPRPDFYETWLPPVLEPTPPPDSLVDLKSKTKNLSITAKESDTCGHRISVLRDTCANGLSVLRDTYVNGLSAKDICANTDEDSYGMTIKQIWGQNKNSKWHLR